MSDLELKILRFIPASEAIHPRDLALVFGGERSLNAWGSFSKTTTRLLHALHFDGRLRVAGRREGIRLYEHASKPDSDISDPDRLRLLVLQVAAILAPLPTTSLRLVLKKLSYAAPHLEGRRLIVSELIRDGSLLAGQFGEIQYVWPEGCIECREPEEKVRFLAPFDPLVWDRARFEQLWGWSYRFEAYTPPAKRKLGYYALPMLWRDDVIGWVNIKRKGADLDVVSGFAKGVKATTSFKREFSVEVDRFRSFLNM